LRERLLPHPHASAGHHLQAVFWIYANRELAGILATQIHGWGQPGSSAEDWNNKKNGISLDQEVAARVGNQTRFASLVLGNDSHVAFDRKNNQLLSNLDVQMLRQMCIDAERFGALSKLG
jgi:hypothetical protein